MTLTAVRRTSAGLDISDAIESYRRNRRVRLSPQTLDRLYVPRLRAFGEWLREQGMPTDLRAIRREHIEAYIEHLQTEAPGRSGAGQKSATVSIVYRTLRTFWRWCVAEEEVSRSPMERMESPKVTEEAPPVITEDELGRLVKAASGTSLEARRNTALLRLLADTGMRRGEMAGLLLEDVNLDDGLITLRGETSKSRRDRLVPLSKLAVATLDKYVRVRGSHPHADQPWLWLGKRGRLTDSGILQVVETLGRRAGIVGLHPHVFRHTFAHSMLTRGMAEGDVATIAGWRDRSMLARYGRSAAAERAVLAFRRFDTAS